MFSLLSTKNFTNAVELLLKQLDQETTFGRLFLVLLPLFLLLQLPVFWIGNEEITFMAAYRRVAPEKFSEFHLLFGQSNARFIIDYFLGNLIKIFGYENAHSIARIMMALLYAVSFGVLFNALKLSVLRSVIVIVIFMLMGQQLFGGEWLFGGVEHKTFAYAAVVAALGLALNDRWLIATILVGIATYFHFLVGGFWVVALALLVFIRAGSFLRALYILLLYFLIISPLLAIIVFEQFVRQPEVSGVNPNELYAMRNAHIVAPFSSYRQFWNNWTTGVFTTIMMALAFVVLTKRTQASIPPVYILILLLYLLFALVASFIDKDTFILSKFFLFRPSSLILLLALATVLSVNFVDRETSSNTITLILRLVAVVLISVFVWTEVKSKVDLYRKPRVLRDLPALTAVIEAESKPTEIVLIEEVQKYGYPYVGLPRQLPRPTFVSWKAMSHKPSEILKWNNRMEYKKSLFEKGCREPLIYPIRLLLVFDSTTLDIVKNCGQVVWQSKNRYLLRIDDRWVYQE